MTIIEITTIDNEAATWMNQIIQWATIPETTACPATEDVMEGQEATEQMVGVSRASFAPLHHHQPQRGTILSSTELPCRATGSGVTIHHQAGQGPHIYTYFFVLHDVTRYKMIK